MEQYDNDQITSSLKQLAERELNEPRFNAFHYLNVNHKSKF